MRAAVSGGAIPDDCGIPGDACRPDAESPAATALGRRALYDYVTERGNEPEFWFRAHANAITFGLSVEE
jgi:hypothetical protein